MPEPVAVGLNEREVLWKQHEATVREAEGSEAMESQIRSLKRYRQVQLDPQSPDP